MAALRAEALSTAVATDEQAKQDKKRPKRVKTIEEWMECFIIYAGVLATKQPERAKDLFAYAHLIVHAARQYKEGRWQAYDIQFSF